MARRPAAKRLAREPVTTRAILRPFIFCSSDSLRFAMTQPSHRSAPLSLVLPGIQKVRLAPCSDRVRLPAALRRRHALLRLVDRTGAAPARAPGRDGEPLHAHAAARRARLR